MALPAGMQLRGVAIGQHTTSPVTLLLEETVSQSSTRLGAATLTTRQFDRKLAVLDNRTLRAGGWSQPVFLEKLLGQPEQKHLLNFGMLRETPVVFPTSHTGQIVTMPGLFLALGGGLSVAYPFGQMDTHSLGGGTSSKDTSTGSISGLIAARDGTVYKGGVGLRLQQEGGWGSATPCGRYKIVLLQKWDDSPTMEVRQLESNEVLFRMGGISPLVADRLGDVSKLDSRVMMLGDNGPLALFNASGQVMQLVDCSIPDLARTLNPKALHVVSQPVPCVVEGGTFQYQVQMNNPELMGACHLQGEIPGAAITPQGLLRFTAPTGISAPTKVQIAIEVTSKTGDVLVHDFPIFVLPVPKPAGMRKAGPI